MTLPQLLIESAVRHAGQIALRDDRRAATYAQLLEAATAIASALIEAGLERGDRVILAGPTSVGFVEAYFGILLAGGIAVPLPGGAHSDRLPYAIRETQPRACIVSADTVDAVSDLLAGVPAVWVLGVPGSGIGRPTVSERAAAATPRAPARTIDIDLAAIIYTSGSTGQPRGVMLTHLNMVANARSIVQYLELTSADNVMAVLPFHYIYGLSLLHTHLLVGGTITIEGRFAFPQLVTRRMHAEGITGFAGVPSTFALLLQRDLSNWAPPTLRYVTQAGGPMPPAHVDRWREAVPSARLFIMYGATEAAGRLTYLPPDLLSAKPGSIGRAISNTEVRVLREDGSEARVGEVGELVARGANISSGYWQRPEDTARAFTPAGYRTGDLGHRDADGCLFITGRRGDMMKVGAHRVGAREIEDVMVTHPAVSEVAVVPVPDDILGEIPVAFVVGSVDADEVRRFCRERLPEFKVPAHVFVEPQLPKNEAGKVRRAGVRAIAMERLQRSGGATGT